MDLNNDQIRFLQKEMLRSETREQKLQKLFRENRSKRFRAVNSLSECNLWFFLHSRYVLKDLKLAKSYLISSALFSAEITQYLKFLEFSRIGLLNLLLSDSDIALNGFKNWEYIIADARGTAAVVIHQIIKGDMVRANEIFTKWRDHESFKHDAQNQFLEGIFESNMDKMYEGISYFLTPEIKEYSRREGTGVTSEIFSFAGTLFTKLAWILGYELEFDSPNIDMELMPIQPLEEYKWPYDFELNNTDISMYK